MQYLDIVVDFSKFIITYFIVTSIYHYLYLQCPFDLGRVAQYRPSYQIQV